MVAVITINYNLSHETIPCVESVLCSDYNNFIIFLVDNGSKDEDFQMLVKAFGSNERVKILRIEKNCGYVGGVNHGLLNASQYSPNYYMVMNNDTVIDKDAIRYLVESAQRHNNSAIISGKVYYFDNPDTIQHTGEIITDFRYLIGIAPGKNEKDLGQFDIELERDALDDVFWLIPAHVYDAVGLYSNYFFLYAEQGDYALRARKLGFKLIFTPKAKLWHKVSMTTGNGNKRALKVLYWRGQGLFVLQYRHLKRRFFIAIVVKNFVYFTLRSIIGKKENRAASLAMLRGYFWGLRWMFNKKPNDGKNPYI